MGVGAREGHSERDIYADTREMRGQVAQGQEEGTGGNSFWEGLGRD